MTVRLALHQLRYELRAFRRTPQAVFFTFALPLLMLVVFATLNGDEPIRAFGGRRFVEYFVPGMLAFGAITATYGNLAARTVYRRETGQLKRLRATPLPAASYLIGAVANAAIVSLAVSGSVIAVGRIFYDVAVPNAWPALVGLLLVGAVSFSAMGLAVSTYISNPEAADATIFATMLPVLFISGVFQAVPTTSTVGRIAAVFPIRHMLQPALAIYSDTPVRWNDILVVLAWGAVGTLIATRRMRWTPR